MTRSAKRQAFLEAAGWADAASVPLAGDASSRRYERLTRPGTAITTVLMDAPPDRGEDTRPFVRIARHLSSLGLSAPEILSEDCVNCFLLLEDLGDAVFARLIKADPALEMDTAFENYDLDDDQITIPPAHIALEMGNKRRSGRRAALAIMAVAFLGGTAVLGSKYIGGEEAAAPIILASTDPVKVKPKEAGGKVVLHLDAELAGTEESHRESGSLARETDR